MFPPELSYGELEADFRQSHFFLQVAFDAIFKNSFVPKKSQNKSGFLFLRSGTTLW